MKITKIEIKDFRQFKNFKLDLTYPKGHPKEGKPLDKVCFIGQSGTGKTSLLELIPIFLFNHETNTISKSDYNQIFGIEFSIVYGKNNEYSIDIKFEESEEKSESNETGSKYSWQWTNQKFKNKHHDWTKSIEYLDEKWNNNLASKLIYFPASLNFSIDYDNKSDLNSKKIIDFSSEKVTSIWNLILDKIQKYQENEIAIRQEISRIVEHSSNDLETIQKALKKLEDWKKNEFNPIIHVAENCLNDLLVNFHLKVKTEVDFKTKDDIGFIKIEDLNGNEVPHWLWSTGTKQIVLSALPLYLLNPKNTVILFDEPERSLYPDLQRLIINYYTSLSENCQFFFSTHSPIVASSFDPWEIVELKFNPEGKVYRELYYKGENHVDNYEYNPKMMRWDDILQRIFDLKNDGSDERQEKLNELAFNNVKLKKLQRTEKKDSEEAKLLAEKILKLSNELSKWD